MDYACNPTERKDVSYATAPAAQGMELFAPSGVGA